MAWKDLSRNTKIGIGCGTWMLCGVVGLFLLPSKETADKMAESRTATQTARAAADASKEMANTVVPDTLVSEASATPNPPPTEETREKSIPGIAAVDVYGNFEKQGFACTDWAGPSLTFWTCKDETAERSFVVEASGPAPTQLILVSGTALDFGAGDVDDSVRPFLEYLASLQYTGADISAAKAWVSEHVGEDAETMIGGVHFQLYAEARSRMLQLSMPRDE